MYLNNGRAHLQLASICRLKFSFLIDNKARLIFLSQLSLLRLLLSLSSLSTLAWCRDFKGLQKLHSSIPVSSRKGDLCTLFINSGSSACCITANSCLVRYFCFFIIYSSTHNCHNCAPGVDPQLYIGTGLRRQLAQLHC